MKLKALFFVILVISVFAVSAMAVPPGDTVTFGDVVFDGKFHADVGFKCEDCHTAIFEMTKGTAKITMKNIREGKYCGACHNGTKASDANDITGCAKCHKK